jgi:segregation and condensation protein A
MLELVQQQYIGILIGEGRNNFIVEWNDTRQEEAVGLFPGDEEPYIDQFK